MHAFAIKVVTKNISRYTKTTPSLAYSENPRRRSGSKREKSEQSKEPSKTVEQPPAEESPIKNTLVSDHVEVAVEAKSLALEDQTPPPKLEVKSPPNSQSKQFNIFENSVEKSPEAPKQLAEKFKLKLELKLDIKKSPKKLEKPKVNIFLEDSDEVDEFESAAIVPEVKSRWSPPTAANTGNVVVKLVPTPIVELKKRNAIPVVIESPEKSPVPVPMPVPMPEIIFENLEISKSPSLSPPPKPTKVRNVCSFLSDIASGSMFSGLDLDNGFESNSHNRVGLNLDYFGDKQASQSESKKVEKTFLLDDNKVEPDTTQRDMSKTLQSPSDKDSSDDDDTDSDTSSSSSDSDDTTSESEESSDSSDEDVPTFSRGFGRFDASSMPMVTQIKPAGSAAEVLSTPTPSRFQPHQSLIKPPGLVTNIVKPALYTPPSIPVMPTIGTPFGIGNFPIPFKIYSLRETPGCEMVFPSPVQPAAVTPVSTPSSERSDKKSAPEKDKREKERRRSRTRSHSRDRDRKRAAERRRSPASRRRSPSPAKKRHADDRSRQVDDRKDSRRRDPSPRHSSHSSRASHGSRYCVCALETKLFINATFFLGTARLEGNGKRDHDRLSFERGRLALERHRDPELRLRKSGKRQREEVFREVRLQNTEEAPVRRLDEPDHRLQASEEARDEGSVHLPSPRIAIVAHLLLISAMSAVRSPRHSAAARATRLTNRTQRLVTRSWRSNSICRRSSTFRSGTTR